MKRFMNKKVAAIGLAAGLALGVAGGAFAYFTTTGPARVGRRWVRNMALDITQTNTISGRSTSPVAPHRAG